ncbi:MAG: hypothetical protein JXR48_03520 [Candidatus Delongbacteria bacterium]|nr:hypothetical protein [Candidatus Delongbacteria bacterium]MBN2834016.1 hypothetical protein [Candidatus Delongbacteria bacterium]
MKKVLMLLISISLIFIVGCSSDSSSSNGELEKVSLIPAPGSIQLLVGGNQAFFANFTHTEDEDVTYSWNVNNTEVGTDMSYTFVATSVGAFTIVLKVKGGSDSKSYTWTINVTELQTMEGVVSGEVYDAYNFPLGGVTVSCQYGTTTTNENGWFVLNFGESVKTDITLELQKEDYITTYKTIDFTNNSVVHVGEVAMMNAVQENFTSSIGSGDLYAGSGIANFESNLFVDQSGNPYDGEVYVEFNSVNADNPNYLDIFPGSFVGETTSGTNVQLISIGIMSVSITGENKQELKIADGKTATIKLQKPLGMSDRDLPNEIPMWHLDEETGIWIEEGVSVLNENGYYETEVSHFSTWNWDIPMEETCIITGYVLNLDNDPVNNAWVVAEGAQGMAWMSDGYTDQNGYFEINGAKNSWFNIVALSGTNASQIVNDYIGTEIEHPLYENLILTVNVFTISLSWGEQPFDLDSHLIIPSEEDPQSQGYHIYYDDFGDIINYPNALLDTDDTFSYGPEIISGFHLYQGTYEYWIYNYTGEPDISTSQASVVLNINNQSYSYTIPTNNPNGELWWHVFNIEVNSNGIGTVVPVNQLDEYTGLVKESMPKKR